MIRVLRFLVGASLSLSIIFCINACKAVRFYEKMDTPIFYSNKADFSTVAQADSLNVVTFNIKKARKIDLAIKELQSFEKTRKVDIYLLQEMDEQGVESIATALGLQYIYIPIVYDAGDKKNIGTAILARGVIEKPEKLILPHAKWTNKQRRAVTIAEVTVHQKKILVYSIHTETLTMSKQFRLDQINGIIEHAKKQSPNYDYTLIGGDFNTLLNKDAPLVVERFISNGFDWPTANVGTTARAVFGLVTPRHDYLFSKGLKLKNAFRIENSHSSDHYPVFATFGFKG